MDGHRTEGVGSAHAVAEGLPSIEGFVLGFLGFSGDGEAAHVLTRAEITNEAVYNDKWCSDQGVGCLWCCSK
jgi:hypothetical protein